MVFHATADDRCVGPGRMWPPLAREFAAAGARCLRFDRSGVGETSDPPPSGFTPLYVEGNVEDCLAVDAELRLPAGRRLHTGLSSGAWMATRVALARPGTRLVALGPLQWRIHPDPVDAEVLAAHGWDLDLGRAPLADRDRTSRAHRIKTRLRTRMPYALWRALARTGRVSCPEAMLRELLDRGVETTLVFPAGDRAVFEGNRGSDALSRLGDRAAALDIRDLEGGLDDHVLMSLGYREQTAATLREAVAAAARGPGVR